MNNEHDFVKVRKNELVELIADSLKLSCLEIDGVDNWEWYMESESEMIEEMGRNLNFPEEELEELSFHDIAIAMVEQQYEPEDKA